jgi:hypothetical protein
MNHDNWFLRRLTFSHLQLFALHAKLSAVKLQPVKVRNYLQENRELPRVSKGYHALYTNP